jgi:hypothetical protein
LGIASLWAGLRSPKTTGTIGTVGSIISAAPNKLQADSINISKALYKLFFSIAFHLCFHRNTPSLGVKSNLPTVLFIVLEAAKLPYAIYPKQHLVVPVRDSPCEGRDRNPAHHRFNIITFLSCQNTLPVIAPDLRLRGYDTKKHISGNTRVLTINL